jgi:hypothetical protein
MTAMWKKDLEVWYVEQLRRALSSFPAGQIVPAEAPDFVVHTANGALGIEVTAIYQQPVSGQLPLQAVERLREYVVQRAQAIHESRGGPPLYLSAYFSPNARLSKSDVEACAEQLAEFVVSIEMPPGSDMEYEETVRGRGQLPAEFSALRVYRVPGQVERFWAAPSAGFVPHCTPEDLQAVLDTKSAKVDRYRTNCEHLWLLIAINGFALSASLDVPESTLTARFHSRFDRAFLLENHRSRVWELILES